QRKTCRLAWQVWRAKRWSDCMSPISKAANEARATVAAHRQVQARTDRRDKAAPKEKPKRAMQAGARLYPEPPMPKQHQAKPGDEALLDPRPMFDAPYYKGSEK